MRGMAPPIAPRAGREYRIDFFRGLALLSIFINHIHGNFWGGFTQRNWGFSDAAELFVLLAGVSSAFAYWPRFVDGRWPFALARIGKRIVTLYVAHITMLAVSLGLFAAAYLRFGDPWLIELDERKFLFDRPLEAIAGMANLTYQTGGFNILPMYIGLLLLLPVLMLLARIRLWLPVAFSIALWLVAHVFRLTPPNHVGAGWFFNPLGWQLLFSVGLVWGIAFRDGVRMPYSRPLHWGAAGYLAVAAGIAWFALWSTFPELPSWFWIDGFDKGALGLFRFVHILALCYVIAWSPIPGLLQRWLGGDNPIVRLGRNTLPVFCLGSILSNVGLIIRRTVFGVLPEAAPTMSSLVLDTLLVIAGGLLLYGLAWFLDWSREEKAARRATAPALAGAALPSVARAD